jgi:hypothetical protein
MAVAKKKAVPAKGAWVPPWAKKDAAKKKTAPKKKVVAEKKTGEKYASKAAMAKHEKGESKKMRMMEGEIKKYADGGKQAYKKTNDIYTYAHRPKERTYVSKQVLQKGDKTIVNKKEFLRMEDGFKFPTSKSTTVYDKKTGVTKKTSSSPQFNGLVRKYDEGPSKYTEVKKRKSALTKMKCGGKK